jgi:hypothetical protein
MASTGTTHTNQIIEQVLVLCTRLLALFRNAQRVAHQAVQPGVRKIVYERATPREFADHLHGPNALRSNDMVLLIVVPPAMLHKVKHAAAREVAHEVRRQEAEPVAEVQRRARARIHARGELGPRATI